MLREKIGFFSRTIHLIVSGFSVCVWYFGHRRSSFIIWFSLLLFLTVIVTLPYLKFVCGRKRKLWKNFHCLFDLFFLKWPLKFFICRYVTCKFNMTTNWSFVLFHLFFCFLYFVLRESILNDKQLNTSSK